MAWQKVRSHMHESIQHSVSLDDGLPEGSMLLGWVCVAEWMAPDGDRWLSCIDGSTDPERGATEWQRQGYLHNALNDHGTFGEAPDDE